jgi:hypothetical protein
VAGERGGLPLAVILSAANANDATMLETVLEDIPPICMPSGRRRRRPGKVHGGKPTTVAAAAPTFVVGASARGSPAT